MSDESTQFREPTPQELRLLVALVALASEVHVTPNWRETVRVQAMADGGMGSLRLATDEALQQSERLIGWRAAELQFIDADGVSVLASLNLDQNGELLELDMWKTDFSSLVRIPDELSNEPPDAK